MSSEAIVCLEAALLSMRVSPARSLGALRSTLTFGDFTPSTIDALKRAERA